MALDGLLGDVQHRADLVVGVRLGDELDDLLLTRSQDLAAADLIVREAAVSAVEKT